MVFTCCVRTCTNTNKDQKMYSFPKELEMARRWFALFGRDDFIGKEFKTVRKNYRVCGAHFDSSWMFEAYNNRTDLKQNSIPSLKLPGKP